MTTQVIESDVYYDGAGNVVMAEQQTGCFTLHTFFDIDQLNRFMETHPTVKFVRPSRARGRKTGYDTNHLNEFL